MLSVWLRNGKGFGTLRTEEINKSAQKPVTAMRKNMKYVIADYRVEKLSPSHV